MIDKILGIIGLLISESFGPIHMEGAVYGKP
jgi:hypothetical protein